MTIPFFPRRLPWRALLLAGLICWAAWLTVRAAQPRRQVFRDARRITITLQGFEGPSVSFLVKQLKPRFPKPK